MKSKCLVVCGVLVFSGLVVARSTEVNLIDYDAREEGYDAERLQLRTLMKLNDVKLDKLDVLVQKITPDLKDSIELRLLKLLQNIEKLITNNRQMLDKNIEITNSKIDALGKQVLEINAKTMEKMDRLENYLSKIHESNLSKDKIHESNLSKDKIHKSNLSKDKSGNRTLLDMISMDKNPPSKNVSELGVKLEVTVMLPTDIQQVHNNSNSVTTTGDPDVQDCTEVPQCCTAAELGKYVSIPRRAREGSVRHTASSGRYMEFGVRGEWVSLLLSSTNNQINTYYNIVFSSHGVGNMYMYERLPSDSEERYVYNEDTSDVISVHRYTYYYVHIHEDKLTVGKRGEPPLVTRSNSHLRTLRFFSFRQSGSKAASAVYECPAS